MYKIDFLNKMYEDSYIDFLDVCDNAMFYHSIKYKDFLLSYLNCNEEYVVALKDKKVVGSIPLMSIKTNDGKKIYNSLPYYGSNGGVLSTDIECVKPLREVYNENAKSNNTLSSTIISTPFDPNLTGIESNYSDFRIGQITLMNFEPSNFEEDFIKAVDSSAKRNIKKAKREGISVEIDNSAIESLYEMHYDNMYSIGGKPKDKKFFQMIDRFFIQSKDYNLYVAKKDGVIIACLLLFYYKNTVEYFTPAIKNEFRTTQPLSLIIETAMKEAVKYGYKYWNWGGTWKSQTGVYRFKKKWGAVDYQYNYYTQLNDFDILNYSPEEISNKYANFYIVPFENLVF